MLEGTFAFLLSDEVIEAGPGSLVFVPRGMVHAPRVVGPSPGRVLIALVPGGAERAFDEFAALAAELGGHPDPDDPRILAINDRYDSVFVGPPLEADARPSTRVVFDGGCQPGGANGYRV